jgi:hypothetical protein
MGGEPASGADEEEEKRDFRSAEARSRAAKADGVTAEAQAGDPLLRHHYFSGSYVPHGICGRVILVYCATKRKFL